jgi:hypothetical protein
MKRICDTTAIICVIGFWAVLLWFVGFMHHRQLNARLTILDSRITYLYEELGRHYQEHKP